MFCDKNEFLREMQQDTYTDLYGYKINWTDTNDGWTEEGRKKFLRHNLRSKGIPIVK